MRTFMIWLLGTDGIVLLLSGLSSLLLVPGSVSEPYLSTSRMLYGVLPTALGAASLGCVVWVSIARRRQVEDASHPSA